MRPLARLRAPPRDPPGRRDRRHARRPRAAPAAPRALARGPRLVHAVRRAREPAAGADRRSPTREPVELDARLGRGTSSRAPTRARRSRPSRTRATPRGPWTVAWVRAAVADRLGRAHDDLPARSASSSCAATAARSTCSTRSATTRRPASSCASEIREHFVPRRGRGVPRPRRLRLRRRRDRDGVDDRVPGARPARAAARRSTSSRTTSRSSSPPRRSRSGPRRPTGWATAASPTRRGWRTSCATRYGLEARWFECGTDLDVFPFAGEEGRERETDRRLRAPRDRAARRRPRDGRARRARRAPADDPARAVRLAPAGRRCRSPPRTSASCRRGGWPQLYREAQRRASCSRSPPTRWWRTR